MPIDDAEAFTVSINNIINPLKIVTLINGIYTEYNPAAANLQAAVTTINTGGGELWLPDTTRTGEITTTYLSLSHNNIQIHGWGVDKTVVHFTGNNYGIIASLNPSGSGNSWAQYGLQNIQLDNFKFTGSGAYLVIRNNLLLDSVIAEDITHGYAGIRVICPYGDAIVENVQLLNCQVNRANSMCFALWSTDVFGVIYKNILFDGCMATRAGHNNSTTTSWSVGYNLGEVWNITHGVDEAHLQNVTIQNCEAYECWESGFHIENKIRKTGVHFINCISNNNGRKYNETNNDGGEAWGNPYGAGYLHSFNANPNDSDMTFHECVADGNGAWGYRGNATPCPVFISCTGNQYPNTSSGNGRYTIPKGAVGGLCRTCCTGITTP